MLKTLTTLSIIWLISFFIKPYAQNVSHFDYVTCTSGKLKWMDRMLWYLVTCWFTVYYFVYNQHSINSTDLIKHFTKNVLNYVPKNIQTTLATTLSLNKPIPEISKFNVFLYVRKCIIVLMIFRTLLYVSIYLCNQ